MKIAVCDDEAYFRELIKFHLVEYMKDKAEPVEINEFESGKHFVSMKEGVSEFDIVFLDINMKELNGIETAKILRDYEENNFLIFVTAYMDYTLEGYQVEAFRYILKKEGNIKNSIHECMDAVFKKKLKDNRKVSFNFQEGERRISIEKLMYIESKLHKLEFHIMEDEGEKIYSIYKKLDSIEEQLQKSTFVRIHQSYLVNMKHIKNIVRYKVIMKNKIEFTVPRSRYKIVMNAFIAYRGEL